MDEFGSETKEATSNNSELIKIAETTPGVRIKRNKKLLNQIETMLGEEEKPLAVLEGQSPNQAGKDTIGIAVATNKRLIYVGTLLLQTAVEQFPLDKIDSVQESKGALLAGFSASVPGSTFTLSRCAKNAASVFVETLRNAISNFQKIPESPQTQSSEGALDKLKKLADLHDAGVLSDDEFESKKAELLDQV